jgi:hypothetical protein
MENLKDNCFISFGMGNGKTLLCVAIAIIFAKLRKIPVFIIGKNAHLVLRDSKKFEQLILSMGLKTNTNQYSREPGVYYYTQKDLETASSNGEFSKVWRQSVAVLDENDWLMFEGTVEQMAKMMKLFRQPSSVVGLTGSTMSNKELGCLMKVFSASPIKFPTLA